MKANRKQNAVRPGADLGFDEGGLGETPAEGSSP